jgi:hypothetical protein
MAETKLAESSDKILPPARQRNSSAQVVIASAADDEG